MVLSGHNVCDFISDQTDLILVVHFRYILESASFELFFKYAELPNFDIASDALCTFKVRLHFLFINGAFIFVWLVNLYSWADHFTNFNNGLWFI